MESVRRGEPGRQEQRAVVSIERQEEGGAFWVCCGMGGGRGRLAGGFWF